jgi:hypothetical protein
MAVHGTSMENGWDGTTVQIIRLIDDMVFLVLRISGTTHSRILVS